MKKRNPAGHPSKIYHVTRDQNKTLKEQKKDLKKMYPGFYYLGSDGRQVDFIAF